MLAHKRPRLVPIRDQYVLDDLMGTRNGLFTQPLRDALALDTATMDRLRELASGTARVPDDLSPLRVLDVVVWMQAHGDAQVAD